MKEWMTLTFRSIDQDKDEDGCQKAMALLNSGVWHCLVFLHLTYHCIFLLLGSLLRTHSLIDGNDLRMHRSSPTIQCQLGWVVVVTS